MPTKHKRKRDPTDKSNYDLPPTTKARSLPVIAPTKDFIAPRKKQKTEDDDGPSRKKRSKKVTDDTPKAFARLMAWHVGGRKLGGGLDDGVVPTKKQKKEKARKEAEAQDTEAGAETPVKTESAPQSNGVPKIQPGETLGQYGIRIDQALPLSSLPKVNVNANSSLRADLREAEKKAKKLTKHNKRLARMQSEWRNTEAKLRAREEEEEEENIEKREEEKLLWDGVRTTGKKGKKKLVDDDPWKELEKKRRAEYGKNLALTARDHAKAPPELNIKKLNPFKEKPERPVNGASAAEVGGGSAWKTKVKRRDELDTIRTNHIEAARTKLRMQANRSGVSV